MLNQAFLCFFVCLFLLLYFLFAQIYFCIWFSSILTMMCQELVLSECILLWFLVVSEIFISFKILVTIFIYIPPLFHSSSPLLYGLQIPLDWPFHYDSYSFIHFSHFAFFYFFVLPIEYFCCCCSLLLSLGLSNPLGNIFQLFLFFNSRIIIWFFYMVLVRC